MEEALVLLLQFLFELIINIFSYMPFDFLPTRQERGKEAWPAKTSLVVFFLVGALLGWLSLLLFKHTLIGYSWIRIANVLVAPLISGFYAQLFSGLRKERYPDVLPREHFWQAFNFSLAFALVRFTYAVR